MTIESRISLDASKRKREVHPRGQGMTHFSIPLPNLRKWETRIETLNQRAKSVGSPGISLRKVGEEETVNEKGHYMCFHVFELVGDELLIRDWRFVGRLQHKKEGIIIRNVPGMAIPRKYRVGGSYCEHCNTNRKRKDTYVLQFKYTATYKQVGSNCLEEFLGESSTAKALAGYGELLDKVAEAGEKWSHPPAETWMLDTRTYLGYVLIAIRRNGWNSKAQARDHGKQSTAEFAFRLMETPSKEDEKPSKEDLETVDLALEWAKAQDNGMLNDYLHNLAVLSKCRSLELRDIGLAASLIPAYQRSLVKNVEQYTVRSTHFGRVGERGVFQLIVNHVSPHESRYGTTHLHIFRDEEGNRAIWWSSSKVLEVGKNYQLRCTVKEHAEYKGRAQTVLTRCVIV